MKRKVTSFLLAMLLCMMLVIPASAASAIGDPLLTQEFNSYPQTLTVQIINTAELEDNYDYTICDTLEVGLILWKTMYPFGEPSEDEYAEIICDKAATAGNPEEDFDSDPSVYVYHTAYNYQLDDDWYYMNKGYALATYTTQPGKRYTVEESKTKYFDGTSFYDNNPATGISDEMELQSNMSLETQSSSNITMERGKTIAGEFGNVPSNYKAYYNDELEEAIGFWGWLNIHRGLYLCYGDMVPTYFLSPDGNTVIGVKQDKEGAKYSRIFEKTEEGEWEPAGDFLRIEAEANEAAATVTQTTKSSTSQAEEIPEDYICVNGNGLCEYLNSVEEYLAIRKLLDGGRIEVYYIRKDGEVLMAHQQNALGETDAKVLERKENGQWEVV